MRERKAMPSSIYLYVIDCDAAYKRALEAGATSLMEPKDKFYGDPSCGVKDPVGNNCFIATHKEDLSKDELDRRAKVYGKKQLQQR
jgi:PhnB protein